MQQIQFNETLLDNAGVEHNITGKASGLLCYEPNPCGLESSHQYHGHQSGWYIHGFEVYDLQIDGKQRYQYLSDLPDSIREIEISVLRDNIETEFLEKGLVAFNKAEHD